MRLTEYRKKTGQSQDAFGALLVPPASQALVSQWERGITRITLDYAVQIEKVSKSEVTPEDCNAMYSSAAASTT